MSKFNILTYPDKFLNQPTQPLDNIDGAVQEKIDKMALTMYDAPGVGLAAIQVGWDKSLLIYDVSPRDESRSLNVLINPKVVTREGAVSYTHLTLPTTIELCRSRWSPYH